ncbi:secreted insulinase-like peptidase [Cryptosporidium ubiquitum]|uniref:Secreted insulinase-like peptidase n=1 Tax=Cryptosporidium ubiquitum TaxID=857276 RepID=A0A1J4MMX7_9CRYT|nr:secreted insulinase-like peptidase [Cryptosporidium ubiquitum]OII74380.1 secreted insulinase-like peptidase [Cryptosporidium ubiquitum]
MRLLCLFWLFTQIVLAFSAKKLKAGYKFGIKPAFVPKLTKPLLSKLGRTVKNVESSSFVKSKVDSSTYKFLRLRNQMAVFLVSNNNFNHSVITLSVGVGAVMDPEDLPGLASLVQESLCLGTNRFFDSSDFCNFISSIDGKIEMKVYERNSVFTLEVGNQYISTVLDRLSDMIRNPSFPEMLFFAKTEEYSGTFDSLLNDSEFLFQCVIRDISFEDHVFKRLNVLTDNSIKEAREISEINLLEHVKNFYNQQYSSNIMTLVVASGEALSKLSYEVISNFSLVKNLNISRPLPFDLARIIRHPHLAVVGNAIHLKAHSINELILEFPIDYQEVLWDSSPSYYLEYLLKDNSKTSLSNFLTNKGWILKMEVRTNSHKYSFSNFELKFLLTPKGLDKIKSIIQATFIVLEHIKTSPIKQDILVEIQQILKYKFDYYFDVSPRQISEKIIDSFDIKGCSPEEVLIAGNLVRNSNPEEVSAFLDKISIDNLVIFVRHLNFDFKNDILNRDQGIIQELNKNIPRKNQSFALYKQDNALRTNEKQSSVDSEQTGKDLESETELEYSSEHKQELEKEPEQQSSLKMSQSENKNIEFRTCPKFNNKYIVEELSSEFINQINEAVNLIHTKSIGFKIRRSNQLLRSTPLQYFSNTANYRLYLPTILKNAILDYLTVESSASKFKTFHKRIRENINKPVYSSFLFFNNVNFQAPSATFFIRIMIPEAIKFDANIDTLSAPITELKYTKSVKELILSLEVLVVCLKHSNEDIIRNMKSIEGIFSITSILRSELSGVPLGFEIKVKGFLGSIFLALKSFSRIMLNLRKNISQEKFEQIIQSLENRIKTENVNRSSKEVSELILKSIFESKKTSILSLESDYSSITLEQILELSSFLCRNGAYEGAIIGNVNPLQAYTVLNQFTTKLRHQNIQEHQVFSKLNSIGSSMQTWKILDPLSNQGNTNYYYYNELSLENTLNSNSLLYIPFSYFNADSIAFQVLFEYIISTFRENLSLSGVEIDFFPKINEFFLVGFTVALSGFEDISVLSEKLLNTFYSIIRFIKDIQKDQLNQIKKNMIANRNTGSEFGQLESKLLYQVTSRKNVTAVMQGVKSSLIMIDHQILTKTCDLILSSSKFLIVSQKNTDDSELEELKNYIPSGFTKITDINQLTENDSYKFINVPIRFIESEQG